MYVVSYGPPVGRRYEGGSNEEEDKYFAVSTNDCVVIFLNNSQGQVKKKERNSTKKPERTLYSPSTACSELRNFCFPKSELFYISKRLSLPSYHRQAKQLVASIGRPSD